MKGTRAEKIKPWSYDQTAIRGTQQGQLWFSLPHTTLSLCVFIVTSISHPPPPPCTGAHLMYFNSSCSYQHRLVDWKKSALCYVQHWVWHVLDDIFMCCCSKKQHPSSTQRRTHPHTDIYTYQRHRLSDSLNQHVCLDCGRKQHIQRKPYTDTGRTCILHTEQGRGEFGRGTLLLWGDSSDPQCPQSTFYGWLSVLHKP